MSTILLIQEIINLLDFLFKFCLKDLILQASSDPVSLLSDAFSMSFTGLAEVDDFLKASIEERLSVADLLAGPSPDVEGNSSQVLDISLARL